MTRTLAILLVLFATPGLAKDACVSQLPETLKVAVGAAYPSYRLPLVTDNTAEDVAGSKERTGNACLGVAKGNFSGNGTDGWVLGLTQRHGKGALVVVALPQQGKWQLHTLVSWPGDRSRLYVAAYKPGRYDSVLDGPPSEIGEVDHLVCHHDVAVYGATESTGVAYCYSHGKWRHTWFSD